MPVSTAFHRLGFVAGATAAVALASLSSGALIGACDEATTSSARVSLETRIIADDGIDAPFTNAYGWSIRLTKAAVSVGALYSFDGASIFSMRSMPRRPGDVLERWLGVRVAHAHPGHYAPGTAMGQMLDASSADLAQGPSELPVGEGVAGIYRSGRFVYGANPEGAAASVLEGHVVVLEGEAKKGDMTRVFRAVGDAGDALDSFGEPKLEGCAFEEATDVQEAGTIVVHVKPSVWLDQSEFDDVPESPDGAPVEIARDGAAFKAFARGLKKGSSIVFSFSKE